MDFFYIVIAFIAFSVITDAIEGKRKKEQSIPQRKTPMNPKTQVKSKPVVIQETKEIPRKKSQGTLTAKEEAYMTEMSAKMHENLDKKLNEYARQLASKDINLQNLSGKEEIAMPMTVTSTKKNLKQADIHSDVLLHAVAYAQILQPPKAYQYMATRSCRGDWGNNK